MSRYIDGGPLGILENTATLVTTPGSGGEDRTGPATK